MQLPIFKKRLIVRLPLDFLLFGKRRIHDFHSGLFSREMTSLFEKRDILYHAKFIFLSFDMALCIFLGFRFRSFEVGADHLCFATPLFLLGQQVSI